MFRRSQQSDRCEWLGIGQLPQGIREEGDTGAPVGESEQLDRGPAACRTRCFVVFAQIADKAAFQEALKEQAATHLGTEYSISTLVAADATGEMAPAATSDSTSGAAPYLRAVSALVALIFSVSLLV